MKRRIFTKRRFFIYGGLLLFLAYLGGSFYEIRSDHFATLAKQYFESIIDRRVEIGEASFNLLGRVTLKNVVIFNPPGYSSPVFLKADKVFIGMGMTGGDTSAFRPNDVTVDRPEVFYERPDTRQWNTDDFWRNKIPRHDHPTFVLPVTIRNATVHYADSRVGDRGVDLTFHDADMMLSVVSDGSEITNSLSAKDVPAAGHGTFDFLMQSHPNARKAEIIVDLHDADPVPLRPFYDFLALFSIRGGRVNGRYELNFLGDTSSQAADFRINDAEILHTVSGASFTHFDPRFKYESSMTDTMLYLRSLTVFWKNSVIDGAGLFTRKGVSPRFAKVSFSSSRARAEDISFLLCDKSFSADGPVTGLCEIKTEASNRRITDIYSVDLDLTNAAAEYGAILRKEPYLPGTLAINGRFGERPHLIGIKLGASTAEMSPLGSGWKLMLAEIDGGDMARTLTFMKRFESLTASGVMSGALEIPGDGTIAGNLDLSGMELNYMDLYRKRRGVRARAATKIAMIPGGIRIDRGEMQLENTSFAISGLWALERTDLAFTFENIAWKTAKDYMGFLREGPESKMRFDGAVGGRVRVSTDNRTAGIGIDANLDLASTKLEIEGVGTKRPGQASTLALGAKYVNRSFDVESGSFSILNTELGIKGAFREDAFHMSMKHSSTGLDGLKAVLASKLWPALSAVRVEGDGSIDIDFEYRRDQLRVNASLTAPGAVMSFGDTWYKPAGELFGIRTQVTSTAEGIQVERFDISQAGSSLTCRGKIGAGRNAVIDADVRVSLEVDQFKSRTPGLERVKVEGRPAAQALELIADEKRRAELEGKLSGTLEEPRFSLIMDKIMSRVIANSLAGQLKALGAVITSPLRVGRDVLENVFGGGNREERNRR